jgi:hypothetical protein
MSWNLVVALVGGLLCVLLLASDIVTHRRERAHEQAVRDYWNSLGHHERQRRVQAHLDGQWDAVVHQALNDYGSSMSFEQSRRRTRASEEAKQGYGEAGAKAAMKAYWEESPIS